MSSIPHDPIPESAGYGRISIPARLRHDVLLPWGPDGDPAACSYCDDWQAAVEADHVVPVARGGLTGRDNLAAACGPCNREKSDQTVGEWRDWRIERGYCWPPRARADAASALLRAAEEAHGLPVLQAWYDAHRSRAGGPFDAWFADWIDRVHRGQFAAGPDEVALLVAALVAADDALIDTLAAGGAPDLDDPLAARLAAWRDDVRPGVTR